MKGIVPFDYLQLTCNAATFHDFPFPSGNQTWLDEQPPITISLMIFQIKAYVKRCDLRFTNIIHSKESVLCQEQWFNSVVFVPGAF